MRGYDDTSYGDAMADVYDEWYADLDDVDATVSLVAGLAAGGPVLELGVGTGRIAAPLAVAGHLGAGGGGGGGRRGGGGAAGAAALAAVPLASSFAGFGAPPKVQRTSGSVDARSAVAKSGRDALADVPGFTSPLSAEGDDEGVGTAVAPTGSPKRKGRVPYAQNPATGVIRSLSSAAVSLRGARVAEELAMADAEASRRRERGGGTFTQIRKR